MIPDPGTAPRRRVAVIGIGCGDPRQLTLEAVDALRSLDQLIVVDKARATGRDADPLAAIREQLVVEIRGSLPPVVRVVDRPRNRRPDQTCDLAAYRGVVTDWHRARTDQWEQVLVDNPGTSGFLVWGDPAFYDSTLRILDAVQARGLVRLDVAVLPGISSVQVLAARHRIVLHEIGQPIHVTTGRRLQKAVAQGQDNIVVMLNTEVDLTGLEDWTIWWGANLGTPDEALVAGVVGDVRAELDQIRARVKATAGWVMDVYLLRRPQPS